MGLGEGGVGGVLSTPIGPQTWLRSARHFAKTRFRRSPSFQFSATKLFGYTERKGRVEHRLPTPVCPQRWLPSARNFAKTRFRRSPSFQFSAKKIFFDVIFRPRDICFAFLSQFWRLDMQTDLRIECLAIFRSRWTYYELCTTKKLAKIARLRLGPPQPPLSATPSMRAVYKMWLQIKTNA